LAFLDFYFKKIKLFPKQFPLKCAFFKDYKYFKFFNFFID